MSLGVCVHFLHPFLHHQDYGVVTQHFFYTHHLDDLDQLSSISTEEINQSLLGTRSGTNQAAYSNFLMYLHSLQAGNYYII